MKKLMILPLLLAFAACSNPKTAENPASGPATGEWQTLFDGTGTDKWRVFQDAQVSVEEGELVLRSTEDGKGGWLVTRDQYRNFRLEAEYKVPPPNNSGIAFRYFSPLEGHPAVTSYEVNLYNREADQNPSGSIFGLARAHWPESTDPEGWNKMAIEAVGDHLQVFINDEKVMETHSRRSMQGAVALQAHPKTRETTRHEARFRNIRVKALPDSAYLGPPMEDYIRRTIKRRLQPLPIPADLAGWQVVGDGRWESDGTVATGYSGEEVATFLVTEKAYKNFYLQLKFRIEPNNNSGVFIRRPPEAGEVTLDNSLEINVYDPEDPLFTWSTGAVARNARAYSGLVDYDDWNLLEIYAFNDQVSVLVNGFKSSHAHVPEEFVRAGNICLQVGRQVATTEKGASKVQYKDLYIKDMEGIPFLGF